MGPQPSQTAQARSRSPFPDSIMVQKRPMSVLLRLVRIDLKRGSARAR